MNKGKRIMNCPSLISVVMIRFPAKRNLEEEGFIWLMIPGLPWL